MKQLFQGLFTRKASAGGGIYFGDGSGRMGASGLLDRRGDKREMLAQYQSWIYACVSLRARMVAKAVFRVYRRHGPDERTEIRHPVVERLLERPNGFETRHELLQRTVTQLDLTGDCFWYAARNGEGEPTEFWILPVEQVQIVPSAERVIAGYDLRKGSETIRFAPEEVIHFKYPHPADFFYGASPLMAAAQAVDIDQSQFAFQRSFYRNSATPPVVLKTDRKLDDRVFDRLKAEWENRFRGSDKYGRIAVLEQGLSVEQIGINPRDLDWLSTNRAARDVILAVFGVPPSSIGIVEDVNRANAETSERTFLQNVAEPIAQMIDERLTAYFRAALGEELVIEHDPLAAEDPERRARAAEIRVRSGLTTINEERSAEGFAPVAGGDETLIAAGMTQLGKM